MSKQTVLTFIPHYLPGSKFGGPIQSISNLTDWLSEDFDCKIVTSDRDFLSNVPYQNIKVNEWNKVGNAEVLYLPPDEITFNNFKRIIHNTKFDLLYLNSLFSFKFAFLPLLLHKLSLKKKQNNILIAPRGELSKGALQQKVIKKKVFLKLFRYLGFKNNIYWHATDKVEKDDIFRELGVDKRKIYLASNLPKKIKDNVECVSSKRINHLRIIYLSRITAKKNISYLIKILGEIPDLDIELHLYGTVDDNKYWSQCLKKINTLPSNITVLIKGHLEHSEVLNVISGYDLFVLPTKGENYGHAIVESISAGTPVLISTNTPWRNLKEKKVGWDINLDNKEEFREKIRELAKLNADEMNRIKQIVKERSFDVLENKGVDHTKEMFREIIGDA